MMVLLERLAATLTMAIVAWTQFRMGPQNNVVLGGSLQATWRTETGGQISASPTVADGTLYIGNNIGSLERQDSLADDAGRICHADSGDHQRNSRES
jgi:hypothetical protein